MLLPRADRQAAPLALRPWPSVLFTWGPGGASDLHAHHCWHLLVGLDGPLRIRRPDAADVESRAALTRPHAPHAVDATETRVAIVFVEPESRLGERLRHAVEAPVLAVGGDVASSIVTALSRLVDEGVEDIEAPLASVFAVLGVDADSPIPRHPGLRRVLHHLRQAPPEADLSLEALAVVAGLSTGRLMHVFTEEVGVPLRPYLLWLKLERAALALAGGMALSEAAHAAGFSDAAHMSRTFRRMYGVAPSDLRRRSGGA